MTNEELAALRDRLAEKYASRKEIHQRSYGNRPYYCTVTDHKEGFDRGLEIGKLLAEVRLLTDLCKESAFFEPQLEEAKAKLDEMRGKV